MDFGLTVKQTEIRDKCRKFAGDVIVPKGSLLEIDLGERMEVFSQMGQAGLFSLVLPKEVGGEGDTVAYLSGLEEIAKCDAGIAVAMAVTNMVAETLMNYGSEEARDKVLRKVADGTGVPLSFAMTEKQAGSDVKAIETTYSDDPHDPKFFLLEGSKQFITNGDICSSIIVIAKKKGTDLISALLVDRKTTGYSVPKKENKLGLLTANLVGLEFDKCKVLKSSLVGREGEGLQVALSSLDSGRLGIAAQSLGIAEAAFEAAVKYAKRRQQFGHPIGDNQAIAFKLADMRVSIDAGRLLMYRAALLKDKKEPFTVEAAEAKLYCSEMCNRVADEALQIHGGYGYVKEYPLEKYFRDARATTIYEGTSEIQRLVISRDLLKKD